MHNKRIIAIWIVTLIGLMSNVYADIETTTFKHTTDTAQYQNQEITGNISILDLISLVNGYIWFIIGFLCFVFMIWNWYKLIMANWDEKSTDSAKKALLWSAVWIAVCLLAYIIVNLAVRLFA